MNTLEDASAALRAQSRNAWSTLTEETRLGVAFLSYAAPEREPNDGETKFALEQLTLLANAPQRWRINAVADPLSSSPFALRPPYRDHPDKSILPPAVCIGRLGLLSTGSGLEPSIGVWQVAKGKKSTTGVRILNGFESPGISLLLAELIQAAATRLGEDKTRIPINILNFAGLASEPIFDGTHTIPNL